MRDLHIPDMFVFNVGCAVSKQKVVAEGMLIVQNKASCFASMLLNPPPDSVVIDACAAPGMKTTHLAALMKNEGILFANDSSELRAEQMKRILTLSGATCAKVSVRDFTRIEPTEQPYCDAQYILVDPSCSGSGIANRDISSNTESPEKIDHPRLFALSTVLTQLLSHALKFPKVERVVYSTCSVLSIENEDVVRAVLKKCSDSFELEEPPPFPFRTTNKSFLKFTPEKDLTNGFFVAIFQRKETADVNDASEAKTPKKNKDKKQKKRKRKLSVSDQEQRDANVVVKKSKETKSSDTDE